MTDIGAQLASELTRIIECPYPAALTHLNDLLARTDVLTIRACINSRPPCAVSRLATLVCEALPLWAYTVHILSCLCQSPDFRDTLLLQSPGLLDALLAKANSSRQNFDDYAGLCVLLLSWPLPGSVPLPASAQTFFLRVFENASRNPDDSTLKPVYLMLKGACRNLLSLLPVDRRQRLDEVLSGILTSKVAGQNLMLTLWCFGIALLAEYSEEGERHFHISHSSTKRPAVVEGSRFQRQWNSSACRKLFGHADKLNKTIQLIYLSVIWITKGDVDISHEDAVEGIRIAVRSAQTIDRAALEAWSRSDVNARNSVLKLAEKITRTDIDPAIQLEALSFYANVAGEGNVPREVVMQYERCLTSIARLVNVDYLKETIFTSLPLFSAQLQQCSMQALVTAVLDACISPPEAHQISKLITLVEQITIVLTWNISLQTVMIASVSVNDLQEKIWELAQLSLDRDDTVWDTYVASLHQRMVTATIALLLNLALVAHPTESAFPFATSAALVKKQRETSHTKVQCTRDLPSSKPSCVSLFQQKNTPYTGQHLQDWRNRLKTELESQGLYQRDAIVRSVAQICQDLETRCETVEEPLRREKERSQELERRVAELSARVTSLEVEATDDRLHLEGLEDEKLNICDERDGLATRLRELELEYQDAIRRADEVVSRTTEDFNAKEMELRSTILMQEEYSYAQKEESETQNAMLLELEQDLGRVRSQHSTLCEQYDVLQQRVDDTEQKLTIEYEINHAKSEEIAALKDRSIELELQLQGTESELDTAMSRLSELQVSHQELKHASEDAYKELEIKYTSDMDAAIARASEESGKLDAQLSEVLQRGQQAEEAHDRTRQELQAIQASVPPLEDRIQELNDFCSEQKAELEELRDMRRKLLAGLGVASQPILAIRPASRGQEHAAEETSRAPREHRRRKSTIQALQDAPKTARGTQGITSTEMENVANASFASSDSHSSQNGSTPKRPKPRPSFKVPVMQTPYTQKPVLPTRLVSKKLSPTKRSALRQLSPNRRHTTVGFAVPKAEEEKANGMRSVRKRRGSPDGIEEADFDMDDFLVGTPMTPGNFTAGTGRMPDDDDVTTTVLRDEESVRHHRCGTQSSL